MIHIEHKNNKLNTIYTIIDYHEEYGLNFIELASLFKMNKNEFEKYLQNTGYYHVNTDYNYLDNIADNYKIIKDTCKKILETKYDDKNKKRYFVGYMMYYQEKRELNKIFNIIADANDKTFDFTEEQLLQIVKHRIKYGFDQNYISKEFNISLSKLKEFEKNITNKEIKTNLKTLNKTLKRDNKR